jgi:hypothetical protein
MTEEPVERNVTWQEYAAGVAVSNAPAWLLNSYRDILGGQLPHILFLLVLGASEILGGAVAGYLVARRTGQVYQKAGITTGLLSFILYFVLSRLIGFEMMPLELTVTLTAFVAGSAVGALYYAKKHATQVQ